MDHRTRCFGGRCRFLGIGTAARYVYETHLIMMMDAESIRIGCFG